MQDLQIYWPLDTVWTEYLARPVGYVSHLLGYEVSRVSCVPPCWMQVLTWMGCLRARMCLPVCLCVGGCGCGCVTPWVWLWLSQGSGSLLTYLKSQHLADGVSTSMEVDSRGFAIFVVDVSLTPFVGNDADKVDEVVAAVYGFLNLVRMVWQPLLHQIFRLRWSLMRPIAAVTVCVVPAARRCVRAHLVGKPSHCRGALPCVGQWVFVVPPWFCISDRLPVPREVVSDHRYEWPGSIHACMLWFVAPCWYMLQVTCSVCSACPLACC